MWASTDIKTTLVNLSLPVILYKLRWIGYFILTWCGMGCSAAVILFFHILRQYIRGARCELTRRLDGKSVLVTGANSGIGFALCKLLCERGATVHLLCRNRSRGEEAVNTLKKLDYNRVQLHLANLADLTSVNQFAQEFVTNVGTLDMLVCNAGLLGPTSFTKTADGHELTYQTNYLAHFLLTEKLLPILSNSGKVINISSIMHTFGDTVDYTKVNEPDYYDLSGLQAYNRSKLAQVMASKQLSLEIQKTIVSCHPGNVHSNILQTGPLAFLENTWVRYLIAFVLKTEVDGAQTPLYVCLADNLVSGAYYRECRLDENVNPLVNNVTERRALLEETRSILQQFL